jgi:putative transposase
MGLSCKTCKDLNVEIIDMAVNVDHVHLFIKYPPKYSVIYIPKRIKGRSSRELRKVFPHLKEWCEYWPMGTILFSWLGWSWMGGCGEIHTESGEAKCEIAMYRLRT